MGQDGESAEGFGVPFQRVVGVDEGLLEQVFFGFLCFLFEQGEAMEGGHVREELGHAAVFVLEIVAWLRRAADFELEIWEFAEDGCCFLFVALRVRGEAQATQLRLVCCMSCRS